MISRFCLEQLCVGGIICQNRKSKKDRSLKKFFFYVQDGSEKY